MASGRYTKADTLLLKLHDVMSIEVGRYKGYREGMIFVEALLDLRDYLIGKGML